MRCPACWILPLLSLPGLPPARAAAPAIFHTAGFEAPVHGAPGDLLLIAGWGFEPTDRVVYEAADPGGAGEGEAGAAAGPPHHPGSVPARNDRERGTARIIKLATPPYALTVQLPAQLAPGRPYRLWVVDHAGEWSRPVSINDPRPRWISPAIVYSTVDPAGLGRRLRVVGRNLDLGGAGRRATVRLRGPEVYTLTATPGGSGSAADAYLLTTTLPSGLRPGRYAVAVGAGHRWSGVPDQQLEVRPDPPPGLRFDVTDAPGACRPDDGQDDTPCLAHALEAVAAAGGGTVILGPGTWDVNSGEARDGLVVPPGVSIRGAGSDATHVRRHGARLAPEPGALLTLTGRSSVTGISFSDDEPYQSYESPADARSMLQLGTAPANAAADPWPGTVDDVVISADSFLHVGKAVIASGRALRRLIVTHDTFGAFDTALLLTGGAAGPLRPYRVEDSIFRDNHFEPGGYLDAVHRRGTIASQIGASHRVDFSANFADGTATGGLQQPGDPRGWRAGFFWSTAGNNEELLISENRISCSGDKDGDGEAIALDTSVGASAFNAAPAVDAAGPDWVRVRTVLGAVRNGLSLPGPAYVGQWVYVVDGPGLGQARRIVGYDEDSGAAMATLHVAPAWDVVPEPALSRIGAGREYWQVYVVANTIDHGSPPCLKSNLNGPHGGEIILWTQIADSVVDGNRQRDSDGIGFLEAYSARVPSCPQCDNELKFVTALEIRRNRVDGEYDWSSDCSWSGIHGHFVATPTPEAPPPWLGFGIVIAHNSIRHADGERGGAIEIARGGPSGPPPGTWPMADGILIYGNHISDVSGPAPRPTCGRNQDVRAGIRIEGDRNIRDTVLMGNRCERVDVRLQDSDPTARVCPAADPASCECRR